MKPMKFSLFVIVFISVFFSNVHVNAQSDDISGAFCTKQSDCSAGYVCDVKQNQCLRDFGGADSVNILDNSEGDLRGQVKTYTSKMLGIPFVILLGALVGSLFLIKKVFGKNSKAGIVKKILVVILMIFIVISLMLVGFALIVTRTVLDTTNPDKGVTTKSSAASYAPNEVLIKFVEGTPNERINEIIRGIGGEGKVVHTELKIYRINFENRNVEDIIQQIETYSEVEYAEPNYLWTAE